MWWRCRANFVSGEGGNLKKKSSVRYESYATNCIQIQKSVHALIMFVRIKPSQMEVAPLHRTLVISHKRRLFRNTKGI